MENYKKKYYRFINSKVSAKVSLEQNITQNDFNLILTIGTDKIYLHTIFGV